jgi:hypothetical protein
MPLEIGSGRTDPAEETRRRRRRRRPRPTASSKPSPAPSSARGADSAEAARVTRSKRYRKIRDRDFARALHRLGASPRTIAAIRAGTYKAPKASPQRLTKATVRPSTPKEQSKARAEALAAKAMRLLEPDVRRSAATAPSATRSGEELLGPGLGPLLPIKGGRPASEADLKYLPLDIASLLPPLRGGRAGVKAVEELAKGASVSGLAKPGSKVAEAYNRPPIRDAIRRVRGKHLAGQRRTRYRGHEAQFPSSPSGITARGQRVYDRASEALGRKADTLRESEHVAARAVGKAVTPVSSRARVPKMAGKQVRQEARRRRAQLAEEIRTVHSVRGKLRPRREGVETAQWYYAQLPKAQRNPEGLALVRKEIAAEQRRLGSGEALREIEHRLAELRAESRALRESGEKGRRFEIIGEISRLRAFARDIPAIMADQEKALRKLDRLIAHPVVANEEVIDSLRVLSRDRAEILTRAGKLATEEATEREGLLSRWLGLEPTGEEVYLGHRIGKVRGARSSGLPAGVGTGRTRVPEGVGRKNKLVLVRHGRARTDLEAAIEDWQAAQAYEFHNVAKDELARMGERIVGRPKKGHVIVNPRGHRLPRTWKVDEEAQAALEGFDPEEILVQDLDEYVANYVAEAGSKEAERMLAAAREGGYLDELRQVPEDVVGRYFGQFLDAKTISNLQGGKQLLKAIGKGADLANDVVYLSLIYANPGYIPSNLGGNLVMAGLHQGAFLPVNLMRAGQLLSRGPKRLRDLLRAEVGFGPTAAVASTGRVKKASQKIGAVPDDWPRISAFLHEAARQGIISKTKPVLSKADYAKLERFLTDPKNRALLNDVRDAGVQAMVDFERLGPLERSVAKRMLFVWSWIRGATRYPFRFALDHPLRTALIGGLAYASQDDLREKLAKGPLPPWLEWSLRAGEADVDGKRYPRILPTRQLNPISTAAETISSALARPGARTFGEFLNPGLVAGYDLARGQREYGDVTVDVGYREAAKGAAERLTPGLDVVRDVISPPEAGGLYPEDTSRLGRLRRASRVLPYAIDPAEAARFADLSPAERANRTVYAERSAFLQAAQSVAPEQLVTEKGKRRLPRDLREAFNRKAAIERVRARIDSETEAGRDREIRKLEAEARLLVSWGIASQADAARTLRWARTATYDELQAKRSSIVGRRFRPAYLDRITQARAYLEERGATLP